MKGLALTTRQINIARAILARLCDEGHLRMSLPVAMQRDEDFVLSAVIDAAEREVSLAPVKTAAASGDATTSPTHGMTLGERIAHVGGRTNAQGFTVFGSPMAVDALIKHVIRDLKRTAFATAHGNAEDLWTAQSPDLDCPACSGSGHKDDAARAALAPPVTDWIDVHDRLPTHLYSVLGVVVDGPLVVAGDPEDRLRDVVSYSPERGCWLQFTGAEDGSDAVVTVSHWQDLPELPQAGKARKDGAS